MEPVYRPAAASSLFALNRRAEHAIREWALAKIEGPQEIIFRSGPVDGGALLSVEKKHFISLAPPTILVLQHRHRDAQKETLSRRFHPNVVTFAVRILPGIHRLITVGQPLITPTAVRLGL